MGPGSIPVIRQLYGKAGESVSLSLLVQLTEEDFWMMPDGYWRGGSAGARKFSDVKLTCTGAAIGEDPLAADFDNALHTLEYIMDSAKSTGATQEGVIKATDQGPKLRFRHQLFQVSIFTFVVSCLLLLTTFLQCRGELKQMSTKKIMTHKVTTTRPPICNLN